MEANQGCVILAKHRETVKESFCPSKPVSRRLAIECVSCNESQLVDKIKGARQIPVTRHRTTGIREASFIMMPRQNRNHEISFRFLCLTSHKHVIDGGDADHNTSLEQPASHLASRGII